MSGISDFFKKAKKKLTDTFGGLGEVANTFKNELSDTTNKVSNNVSRTSRSVMDFTQSAPSKVENYFQPTVQKTADFFQKNPTPQAYFKNEIVPKVEKKAKDYFAPTSEVRARDIVREIPKAVRTTYQATKDGDLGKTISDELGKTEYFKPTEKMRVRDVVREIPLGVDKSLQNFAQGTARFAISAAELPKTFATGKASKKYYNTPLGRINSFQSEAQNRVERGDPLWKAIGNPALDTVLAGSDVGALAKPILSTAKTLSRFGKVGNEVANVADDLTKPLGKTMKLTIPARTEKVSPNIFDAQPGQGTFKIVKDKLKKVDGFQMTRDAKPFNMPAQTIDVPFEFKSNLLKGAQRPGLTIKDVSSGKPSNFPERIAAKNEKAKILVNNQIENQKVGLPKVEPGFVEPEKLPVPKNKPKATPTIEEYVNGPKEAPTAPVAPKQSREPMPSIEEYVNKKTGEVVPMKPADVLPIDKELAKINPKYHTDYKMIKDDMDKAVKDEAEYMMSLKNEIGGVGTYKKIGEGEIGGDMGMRRFSSNPQWYRDFFEENGRAPAKWEVAKIAEDNLKNGNGINAEKYNNLRGTLVDLQHESAKVVENPANPFNQYQQRAFDKKKDRIDSLAMVMNYPTWLRKIGYKKAEIDRIGKDQAERILKLSKLGYPKLEIQKIDPLSDRALRAIENNVPWQTLKSYYDKKHALDTHYLDDVDPSEIKDINSLMGSGRDVYRNFEASFGNNFPKVKERILDPLDSAKGDFIDEQAKQLGQLWDNVVQKNGIKKVKTFFGFKYGDRSSEYVQKVGENVLLRPLQESDIPDSIKRQINLSELQGLAEKNNGDWRMLAAKKLESLPEAKKEVIFTQLKQVAPGNWDKIVDTVNWFRSKYDEMLPELNKVREANYPTHPLYPESTKVIPTRANYFPHSLERDGIVGLKNLFDTPSNIDPSLAVSSEYTKPLSKFLGFAKQRTGNTTDYDAVKGMEGYIKDFAFAKHIDPQIQKFRGMDEEAKQLIKDSGGILPEKIGLAEELSRKIDPFQQITDSTDPTKIKGILVDHGVSGTQADWMSKELAPIGDLAKVKNFIKDKTAKNKENIFGNMQPTAAAEKSDNKLNNFLKFLDNYASDLAGKTNSFDRPSQDAYSRLTFKILRGVASRIKANAVLGNAGSAVSQFLNLPQGVASAGARNTTKGVGDSLLGIFKKDMPIEQSTFLKERYFDGSSRFDESFLATPKRFAAWMMSAGDEVGSKIIWNSHYQKALSLKVPNPVKYADDWTRKLVGGRGVGEVPLMQKSVVYQLMNPFQLEVANQWYALRDIAKGNPGKLNVAKKMIEFAVASYVINGIKKEITGSGGSFNPLNAMVDAYEEYQKEDDKKLGAFKAGGRMLGEVASNLPGLPGLPTGQTLANMYPEYGKDVMGFKLPARKQFFGEGDPTRFGSGGISDLVTGGISDPLYKLLPPFGGAQIKKTYEGTKSLLNGYAENAAGNVMTPVERNVPNVMKGVIFGKNALGEMQSYFDNNQTPLSKEQTEKYKLMGNDANFFTNIANDRKAGNERDALKIKSDPVQAMNLSDNMARLSNGNFYVKTLNREFTTEKEAKKEIAKQNFMDSEDRTREQDGQFWYKDSVGDFKSMTLAAREKTLVNASSNLEMDRAKDKNDIKAWAEAADKKIASLDKYLETLDPAIDQDEIDSVTLAKENLYTTAEKYAEYGGFKKGQSASTKGAKVLAKAEADTNLKMDRAMSKNDLKAWSKAADSKIKAIDAYMSTLNPDTDMAKIDSLTLKKENLLDKAKKYAEQGGFKADNLEEKFKYSLINPEMLKINALIAGNTVRRPVIGKRGLQLIQRRLPVVRRTTRR